MSEIAEFDWFKFFEKEELDKVRIDVEFMRRKKEIHRERIFEYAKGRYINKIVLVICKFRIMGLE